MTPRLRRTPALTAAVAFATVLLAAGCGSDDSSAADSSSAAPSATSTMATPMPSETSSGMPSATMSSEPAAEPVTITIKKFAYEVSGKAAPGTPVKVVNEDATAHTVTLKGDEKIDVNVDAKGKAMFTAPGKAGTYELTCDFHGDMHGELVVA